ncbi:MAG: hypothetical protein OEV42_06505 [Deltaproteobacteria bacterium]|nr:hypothetical protein [Deltaproteobacteria bacterium]
MVYKEKNGIGPVVKKASSIFIAFVLLLPASSDGETEIFGRARLEGAWETTSGTVQKNEQNIDVEIKSYLGEHISVKAFLRGLYETELEEDIHSEGDVRELYIDYSGDNFKARLGRQQVVWGKTDGLKLLDLINPQDFREFILDDFIDSRIPLWMVRGDIYVGDDTLQLLIIPDYRPNDIARSGDRFEPAYLKSIRALPLIHAEEEEPGGTLADREYGIRYSGFARGWDYTLNYFHSWEDNPLFFRETIGGNPAIVRRYKESDMYGGSFSNAFGSFVIRGESAYNRGRYFSTADPLDADGQVKKDEVRGAIGIDYTKGDWLISGQVFESYIRDYDDGIVFDEASTTLSLLVNVKFLNEMLELKLLDIYGTKDKDNLARLSAVYSLTDRWKVHLGGAVFSGPDDSFLGQFDEADRAELEITCNY